MGYNKSLSDVYSEDMDALQNQCETDGYIALNRFCAGTGVNVQRLYEWLRRRKISISDYQRSLPETGFVAGRWRAVIPGRLKFGIQVADESRGGGGEVGISAEGLTLLVDVMTRRSDVES